ncbi:MAG: hypothetical protein WD534_12935 [Phycisphaeraceae bacterium]
MKTFTDSAGRTWTLAITVDAIKRVQTLAGVNLADITSGDPPLLTRLEVDLVLLCDVIYALVQPQAEQAGLSDEQFGQALGGDAILAAHDAFWGALSDFFQSLRRSDQVRAIQKQTALVQAAVAAAEGRIEQLDIEKAVNEAMEGEPPPAWATSGGGDSSGNSPGSSPSTPDR